MLVPSWTPRFAGTRIPTFEEALAVFPNNVWLNCHLKGGAALGEATAKVIAKAGRTHQAFLAAAHVLVNYYHDETAEGLRRQWRSGVNFPLVNDLAKALPVAREFGIEPIARQP